MNNKNEMEGIRCYMELEKQIFDEIVKRMDLDEATVKDMTYDTILFDRKDGQENLGLDSIDALELISLLYDIWKIDIPGDDLKKLYSINAIAEYVRSCGKG